jgi:hypothetical protein
MSSRIERALIGETAEHWRLSRMAGAGFALIPPDGDWRNFLQGAPRRATWSSTKRFELAKDVSAADESGPRFVNGIPLEAVQEEKLAVGCDYDLRECHSERRTDPAAARETLREARRPGESTSTRAASTERRRSPDFSCTEHGGKCCRATNNRGSRPATSGRILGIRSFGKANFLVLSDGRERIQVYIKRTRCGAHFELFRTLGFGDVVGRRATVPDAKTNELTIWAPR